jgi:hypothetical protein
VAWRRRHTTCFVALQEGELLHDAQAQGHGDAERLLTVGDAQEDGLEVGAGVEPAARGAGRAPAAALAREGHEARVVAGGAALQPGS